MGIESHNRRRQMILRGINPNRETAPAEEPKIEPEEAVYADLEPLEIFQVPVAEATKKELLAWAKENLGMKLDARLKKSVLLEMIEAMVAAQ